MAWVSPLAFAQLLVSSLLLIGPSPRVGAIGNDASDVDQHPRIENFSRTGIFGQLVAHSVPSICRSNTLHDLSTDLPTHADASAGTAGHGLQTAANRHAEVSAELSFVNLFQVYRHLLDEGEQRALQLVELRGATYREVADLLGESGADAVSADDVRMLIFTGRKKLHWGMSRTLGELENRAAS